MNDNEFLNQPKDVVTPYKATPNLNTLISNPSMNVENVTDVNIQTNSNLGVTQTTSQFTQSFNQNVAPNVLPNQNMNNQTINTNQQMVQQPNQNMINNNVVVQQKKKRAKLAFSNETKIAFVIALILMIFILVMPSIYDFFKNLTFGR